MTTVLMESDKRELEKIRQLKSKQPLPMPLPMPKEVKEEEKDEEILQAWQDNNSEKIEE